MLDYITRNEMCCIFHFLICSRIFVDIAIKTVDLLFHIKIGQA